MPILQDGRFETRPEPHLFLLSKCMSKTRKMLYGLPGVWVRSWVEQSEHCKVDLWAGAIENTLNILGS